MRGTRTIRMLAVAFLATASLSGCGARMLGLGSVLEALTESDSVALRLILIGDAGLPAREGEPVLKALKDEVDGHSRESFVVYLGDNVYPRGLTAEGTGAEREQGEQALREQIDAVKDADGRGIMIPGNHDWDAGSPDGLAAIRRQDRWVDSVGDGSVSMLPDQGCPGPHVVDIGSMLRLVVLDTQYWLHNSQRPEGPGFSCGQGGEAQVVDSLKTVLGNAGGRHVVVVGHHPLVSGGEHGGYFDWPTYLFPFHPWARISGVMAEQDITGRDYSDMRRSLAEAFAEHPPLVYAAGHEHNLQVFRREPAKYQLVSGGGIYGHTTSVRVINGHLYARRASGYMRLLFLHDGRVRLEVVSVDAQGKTSDDFSIWLTENPPPAPASPLARPASDPSMVPPDSVRPGRR